jgi:hypothetical protein
MENLYCPYYHLMTFIQVIFNQIYRYGAILFVALWPQNTSPHDKGNVIINSVTAGDFSIFIRFMQCMHSFS